MTTFVLGTIALTIGMVALGCAGAAPRRQQGMRWTFCALGMFSTVAAIVLLHRAGGFPALAFVGSGMIVLIGFGVVAWYFFGIVASVDEALTKRDPPPPTDFTFLNQPQAGQLLSEERKRTSMAERMGLTTARERIAKMGWFMRKPPG